MAGELLAAMAGLAIGFVAGLLVLKRSALWCPGCGRVLRCTGCPGQPTPREARTRLNTRRPDGIRAGVR